MHLHVVHAGFFKLDGGAMFGIVPRVLWQKLTPPDNNNLCTWAMRCLLVETADRRILIDTGMGDKQDDKFRSHFHPHGEQSLLGSLEGHGFVPEDITDVLLTHLHFDHVGGAVQRTAEGNLLPTFPNATYWSTEAHFKWAEYPNAREKASFLKENFIPLRDHEQLAFLPVEDDFEWIPGIHLRFAYGHTEAMCIPYLTYGDRTLIYCADLLPSTYHIGLPYIMAYDVRPLHTLDEKTRLLEEALEKNQVLFFEHDPETECATLQRNDRGRIVVDETFPLETLLGA